MRQLLQGIGNGETVIENVPAPSVLPGTLLIETRRSLVSAGTERMLVEFGKSSLLDKARKNPERVKQVLAKAKTDGLLTTLEAVRSKLGEQIPLGYCNAGVVVAVGDGVSGFSEGDRVVSNGSHSELVRVPVNLCARIPDGVTDDAAAFTVLASIGLQGLRLVEPTLGETVAVIGLGLIGLVTVQLLRANGCKVIGLDPNPARCAMAETFGARAIAIADGVDAVDHVLSMTDGVGADAVVIAASTASNQPIEQAAEMSRHRGRIVLIGVVGLSISRDMFYRKELSFQVSCSYGPGRYDSAYEQEGHDYPVGFVRWTEKRNFEAVLSLLADGTLDPTPLITHRYPLADAASAYALIGGGSAALAVLLDFEDNAAASINKAARTVSLADANSPAVLRGPGVPVAGFLGFGNYASRILAPAFKTAGIALDTVVSTGGPLATTGGRKLGFRQVSTESSEIWADPTINIVAIATRHSNHAASVAQGLAAGKAVFVEKPLAIDASQVEIVNAAYRAAKNPLLMVGFNRRFSSHAQSVKKWLDKRSEPASLILLMNAGAIPADHWTQDMAVGGGRIVGEACHLIDLARFLVGSRIVEVRAMAMGTGSGVTLTSDKCHVSLRFEDSSTAVVHYLANGSSSYPKERVEVFCGGAIAVIDNYVATKSYGAAGLRSVRRWRQDKGQVACATAFSQAVAAGGSSPIDYDELIEVARACIEARDQITAAR